jgi:hypothetical protein
VHLGTAWIVCLVLAATAVLALVAAEQFDAGAARTAAWAIYFAALAALAVVAVPTLVSTVSALASVRSADGGPAPLPVLATTLLLLAAAAVPAAYVLLPMPTSARTVANDLERATDAARYVGWAGSCEDRRDGRLRCSVSDPSASGQADYAVRADARCWHGRRFRDGEAPMPPRASGCTTLRDLIGLP